VATNPVYMCVRLTPRRYAPPLLAHGNSAHVNRVFAYGNVVRKTPCWCTSSRRRHDIPL